MPASHLRSCLNSLGGTGTRTIDYISIDHGYREYLNKVCNAAKPGTYFDMARTRTQPDLLNSHSYYAKYGVMYPGHCNYGWLGRDCTNRGTNNEYDGFFCTGIYVFW